MKRILIPVTCGAASLLVAALARAQNQPDPVAPGQSTPPAVTAEPSPALRNDLSLKYEAFSLDLATAASFIRQDLPDLALYEKVVALVAEKKARQETLTVIRTRSGQRSSNESILEYIYPTEWEPAELPNSIGVKIDPPTDAQGKRTEGEPNLAALDGAGKLEDLPLFATPSTGTAFQTRNLGFTLECEPVRRADRGLIDITIAPQHVTLGNLATWGQGVSTLQTPEIESQQVATSLLLVTGLPRLIGTINQPTVSKANPKARAQVWFAFLTASDVK